VAIFTDSQAALKRSRNDDPGPGQWLARGILHAERQLRQAGWTTEFHWIPGHKGIEGNEVADRWAKEGAEALSGAEWLPRAEESITTLGHVARGKMDGASGLGEGEVPWKALLPPPGTSTYGSRGLSRAENQRSLRGFTSSG
jgi:hypothetical protein